MTFRPFVTERGAAAALLQPNIDTDVIIRVDHLTKSRSEVGPFAFEAMRYLPDGHEDPRFPLHEAAFRNAPILLTGPNFGCGSSREPAVWALAGLGIRCLIGTTFGDIFFANCAQNGLLVVSVSPTELDAIVLATRQGEPLTVDLPSQTIATGNGLAWAFEIPPAAKHSLTLGLDDIELAVAELALIADWQKKDRLARPWIWELPTDVEP
jgi:3-isopropylmalate/(R)-2-methylmalate dehydratase small subunit